MQVKFFPNDDDRGQVRKCIKNLESKRPDLFALVTDTIKRIEEEDNLDAYIANQTVAPIDGPIWELRIPKQRRGGVVRIYFGELFGTIHLLTAELKKIKKGDKGRIEAAKKIFKEIQNENDR